MMIEELGRMSSASLDKLVGSQAAIPVLTIRRIKDAIPIAEALVSGGLRVMEVALRTPTSLEAVSIIKNDVPGAIVGVGTVLEPVQFEAARRAGAVFAVSPGMDPHLFYAASQTELPWLPGVETVTEATIARRNGFTTLKHFPGNMDWVKSISGPFPDLKFCVTGGVNKVSAPTWLELQNVWAVGGGWIADRFTAEAQWDQLETFARNVAQLKRV